YHSILLMIDTCQAQTLYFTQAGSDSRGSLHIPHAAVSASNQRSLQSLSRQ
ncbi:unnamed protein product, partial [Closterium sp. NIES-54]